MKTIDINAKEWFDKVNGNSYFSAVITIDFGMPTQKEYRLPFQYGSGTAWAGVNCYRVGTSTYCNSPQGSFSCYQVGTST
jgi:hypothetical protein